MKHDWEYRDFEKCLEKVVYTPKLQSSNYQENGKYPIVSQEDCLISGYWDKEDDVFRLVKPIVVFGDHTRILKYIDFDFVLGADGVKILQPTDDIKAKFLYYYLKWYDVPSLGYSRHYKLLKECIVPIPPTHVQEQICSLLDKMNRVIEAKKEQLKELDNLAQAIFYDMFGDPVTNEKGWSVKSMKVVAPAVEYKGEHPQIDGKFWLLNLDKVEAQTGNILSVDYYEYDEIGNSVVSFDSSNVLYSKLRPYLNKVVVPTEIGFATSELVPLQPVITLLERQYLAYMLRSKQFVDFINSKVSGAKMPRVDMTVFRNFTVPIPPLPLQQAFAEKVEAIERQKELINQSLREVQTLFDSMMDYWFSEEDDDFGQLDKLD